MSQPTSSTSKPAQVFASFDDLVAARASAGTFQVQPTQPAPPMGIPTFTTPLQPSILQPTGFAQPLGQHPLLSPRYDQGSGQGQLWNSAPPPAGSQYSGLISPRYVIQTTHTTTTGNPTELNAFPTLLPNSFLLQPLGTGLQPQQPQQQQQYFPSLQPFPTQPQQPILGTTTKNNASPAVWNPFWEEVKDDQENLTSPREDEEVDVHVVGEFSDDDEEADEEDKNEKRYGNFQLRTSSPKLNNTETKTVTTITTIKATPLTKSEERERMKEEQKAEEAYQHHHALPKHRPTDFVRGRSDSNSPLKDDEPVKFNWHPKRVTSNKVMRTLIQVNCLVQGDYERNVPKWMIPIDNTPASMRALDNVLKLAAPTDHIFIVHVRIFEGTDDNLRETYLKWRNAVKLCRKFKKKLLAAGRPFTILVPVHHDPRKVVCKFAAKFHVSTIAIGKHGEEDKQLRVKNIHFRSFSKYVSKHASKTCRVIIV